MKKILISFISVLLILLVSVHSEVMNYETIGTYLSEVSQGTIFPTLDSETEINFSIDRRNNVAIPLVEEPDVDYIHTLFATDIYQMLKNYSSVDFISAKKAFYKTQQYNASSMQYSRPYVYPSDWHSLFHPPIREINLPHEIYGEQFALIDQRIIRRGGFFSTQFHQTLDKETSTEMTAGNNLTLLSNGQNSFREKMRMIRQAKKFYFSVVMVEYCDDTGTAYAQALFDRVKAGVDVRLIVESVWSKILLQTCLKKLEKGGVKVLLSNGFFNKPTLFTVMHDKFWIRDGEEAIIGGQNMHDFENLSNGFNGHTRDRDVLIKNGPAVTDLLREYIKLWNYFKGKPDPSLQPYTDLVIKLEMEERKNSKRGSEFYQEWLANPLKRTNGLCRVIVQGSQTSRDLISKAYLEIIKNVQFSILIDTLTLRFKEKDQPKHYNNLIAKALIEQGTLGVKIDIISNGLDAEMGDTGFHLKELAQKLRKMKKYVLAKKVDKLIKRLAHLYAKPNHKALANLAKNPNIDGWEYFNHIHSKQIIFDQILTSTGSFNLDKYSYKNHEATMICLDKKLADESIEGFISDIVNSIPVRTN